MNIQDAILESYKLSAAVGTKLKLGGEYIACVHNHYKDGPRIDVFREVGERAFFHIKEGEIELISIAPEEKDNEQLITKMLTEALAINLTQETT